MSEVQERLHNELELLEAMYPEGVLILRLPDQYPAEGLPEIVTAKDADGLDARTQVSSAFSRLGISEGEETLDAFIFAFQEFITASAAKSPPREDAEGPLPRNTRQTRKTVVIWLHHLLNTNKRKLALNPSFDGDSMTGLTKPGYPGVMIFSGPKDTVDSHVAELRCQRWQAFQVRLDSEAKAAGGDHDDDGGGGLAWGFQPCTGVREVESLGEMAQAIARAEHRETFLRVMGLK